MVRHIPCGTFVNESERIAVERLQIKLRESGGSWILLSNLNHAQHPAARSDEIDIVVIGPPGVFVLEVKHWDAAYLRQNTAIAEREADRIDAKAKRVAGKLRPRLATGFVAARFLLTRGEVRFDATKRPSPRGVDAFGLPEWSAMLAVGGRAQLDPDQIELAARLLEPSVKVALSGELRTFAGLVNLERQSNKTDAFHRIYRGQHPTRRDRVILHLYDLSATQEKQALELARREFDTIQRWQKSPFVPSLLDSFQEAEGYPGELYFYSLVDPAAPSLSERRNDSSWDFPARLAFSRAACEALGEFHQPQDPDLAIIHRRLSPSSLRVRHNNQPLFTDFNLTRLQDAETISPTQIDFGDLLPYVAEEVRLGGLAAADARSDIAALCASLLALFEPGKPLADQVRGILDLGLAPDPADRPSLEDLSQALAGLTPEPAPASPTPIKLPPADYWDEDTVVHFQQSRYKIVSRLGAGGIGQTFKVVELDAHSDEKFGTYVAKLVRDPADGEAAIRAYKRVRAYTTHPHLSTIHEIAPTWEPDRFVALMKWVEGQPMQDLTGVLSLYADDLGEPSVEVLAQRWLRDLCDALGELHRVGLVHGDVSPKNLIVQGGTVVLTDYDTVAQVGDAARGGTFPYVSPEVQARAGIRPADDLYALAASLFHCLTDRDPFVYGAERRKDQGLNWEGIAGFDALRPFFDRATHPDTDQRFPDALAARRFLTEPTAAQEQAHVDQGRPVTASPPTLTPNEVPWLRNLLSSYPGSRHGNSETRGLDSPFAEATYVETRLDDTLLAEIQAGQVNLAILFGNAGDGKTAFLQHLAQHLGLKDIHSARRVWTLRLPNGQQLKVNLDGAAAWEGRGANTLLDELFAPFHDQGFPRDRIHIVAVNNGKLLEWIEGQPEDTWLTGPLRRVLLGEAVTMDPRFRLIDLNRRSLVGGIDAAQGRLTADFLDTLIDRLLGGDADPWAPCATCAAQARCTAWHSVQALRDPDRGPRLRERLTDLLQACHQRGEIHITARELRAALSYSLFGVHDCAELHADPDLRPPRYWQRAFDARSDRRQGELKLLAEMTRFDPALEADPILDRRLLREPLPDGGDDHLAQARRRAWFTRPGGAAGGDITLANGRHLARFRGLPLMSDLDAAALLRNLCLGIARLEDLPALAFAPSQLSQGVPLRITPRTPTDSAFWVVKPWERFDLRPALPAAADGLETLHTHLHLIYRYADGGEEVLTLGLELFHALLELKDGVQLSGVAQEGTFANLEIFTQRLAREDARALHGWHPTEEDRVFQVRIVPRDGRQVLVRDEA